MEGKITFEKGKCLNCGTPITYHILCKDCIPPAPPKTQRTKRTLHETINTGETKVSKMKNGDVGFTEEYQIFEIDSNLFIIGNAKITPQSEGLKTVRIKKARYLYEVDGNTIDRDNIHIGWPDNCTTNEFLPAVLTF